MKNKLVFVIVILLLLAMGVIAGSMVYSAIFLASVVNWVLAREWIPIASYVLLALIIITTAYFAARFIRQSQVYVFPEIGDDKILPMTVIIPALNEERTLELCINSLSKARYPEGKLEIIIANEVHPRCHDRTPEIAGELAGKFPTVRVIPNDGVHQGSKAGAINNCLTTANGEIIAIFDADHVIDQNSLRRAASHFVAEPTLSCIGGKVMVRNMDYNLFTRLIGNEATVINNFSRFLSEWLTGSHSVYGSNVFIRKKDLDRIGGFDESSLTEDCDLGMKLISQNCYMRIDYTIKSYEQPPISFRDWWLQRVRWTRGSMDVIRKHIKNTVNEGINFKIVQTALLYALSTGGILFSVVLVGFMGFMLYVNIVPPIVLFTFVAPLAILFAAESILQLGEGRGSVSDVLLAFLVRPWIIFIYFSLGVYSLVLDILDAERTWSENQRI